jgi:hypothetical protein
MAAGTTEGKGHTENLIIHAKQFSQTCWIYFKEEKCRPLQLKSIGLSFSFLFLFYSGLFTWETMNLSTFKFFPLPVASWAPVSVPSKE